MSLLTRRSFLLLALGDAISVFGDQVGWIALLWYVMVATQRATAMGTIALAFGLAGVVAGLILGPWLDRPQRTARMAAVNLVLAVLFAIMASLTTLPDLPFSLLLVLVTAAGFLSSLTPIGAMVLLPRLVTPAQLPAANGLAEMLFQLATLFGPLLGGLLVSGFGAADALRVDAATFLGAALCFWAIREPASPREQTPAQPRPALAHLGQGWSFLRGEPRVLWVTAMAILLGAIFGQLEVSLPLFVRRELHANAATLGLLWTTYSVGAIFGSLASGVVAQWFSVTLLMPLEVVFWGLSLAVVAMAPGWTVFAAFAVAGAVFAAYPPAARTVVQQQVPAPLRGAVFGLRTALIGLGAPTGAYLAGFALALWPASAVMLGAAMLVVAAGLPALARAGRNAA